MRYSALLADPLRDLSLATRGQTSHDNLADHESAVLHKLFHNLGHVLHHAPVIGHLNRVLSRTGESLHIRQPQLTVLLHQGLQLEHLLRLPVSHVLRNGLH